MLIVARPARCGQKSVLPESRPGQRRIHHEGRTCRPTLHDGGMLQGSAALQHSHVMRMNKMNL